MIHKVDRVDKDRPWTEEEILSVVLMKNYRRRRVRQRFPRFLNCLSTMKQERVPDVQVAGSLTSEIK